MKTITGLEWKRCGTLAKPDPEQSRGTFLMVYEGRVKRVFYVGTSMRSFTNRWKDYKGTLNEGLFTFWRGIETGDIYNLMSSGGRRGAEMVAHFMSQAQCQPSKLWGAACDSKIRTNTRSNAFNSNDLWSTEWREYAANVFMPRLALWACPLPDADDAGFLATQIQQALGTRFDLGWYKLVTDGMPPQNWLGKQERRGSPNLGDYRFEFNSMPDIDEESQTVLSNLADCSPL